MIYLNWAGLAPLSVRGYTASLFAPELLGNVLLPKWFARITRLREKIGAWLGCGARQVAFLPSTSAALYTAANSLDWEPGDVALYPKDDFAANVLPWQQLARRGVRAAAIADWSNADWPDRTRMVSISTVDFTSGIEHPWREVISKARKRGIWTVLDAIQSAGVKPAWSEDVDFWCAGTQKWLASGLGLAILVLSERVLQQLRPPFPSWLSLADPPRLESGLAGDARAWEMSWVTPYALARFDKNLDFFARTGWDAVSAAVKARRDFLHERLMEIGWPVISDAARWSGIVSFDPGPERAQAIVQDGYKRKIVTAARGCYVRLSAHVFTPKRSLRKAVDWLWSCRG